jgi:hypothetical protein
MNFNITIDPWVLWGLGIAAGLTFGILLLVSLVAMAITGFSGGFLGGEQPWRQFGATFQAFLTYGLPTGLASSFVWTHVDPWMGVLAGVVVFAAVWIVWRFVDKRRNRIRIR